MSDVERYSPERRAARKIRTRASLAVMNADRSGGATEAQWLLLHETTRGVLFRRIALLFKERTAKPGVDPGAVEIGISLDLKLHPSVVDEALSCSHRQLASLE